MSKICYTPKSFGKFATWAIKRTNQILDEYSAHGLTLTLRQLYYQFVARGYLANKQTNYKRLGQIVGEARLAGKVDWERIEDRSRSLFQLTRYDDAQQALTFLQESFHTDLWKDQKFRPEVWIEKDALSGVIEPVCIENDVPYFSCRGYTSLSEMWRASMRLRRYQENDQTPFIIHFGDHDPSGMDMSRDIIERIGEVFMADHEFERVALNMDQIEEYQPPPNPAKVTDSRYKTYVAEYGDSSWELDALNPMLFRELIENKLVELRDEVSWKKAVKEKERVKKQLTELVDDWENYPQLKKDAAELTLALTDIAILSRQKAVLSDQVKELQKQLKSKKKNTKQ